MGSSLTVKNLTKAYNRLDVIQDWNFSIQAAERVVLLGPSGSGKTTFLRILAGLESPSAGTIQIHTHRIGFVFQEPRLIPWRSVRDNLLFVNTMGDAAEILQKFKLHDFEDYLPSQLSGGMQQRVNLARALIIDPELLILDEAFSSLDLPVKLSIMADLVRQWQEKQFTFIAVTHDLKEALYLADKIIIISSRPARIVYQFDVDLDKSHRSFSDPRLLHLESQLLEMITGI